MTDIQNGGAAMTTQLAHRIAHPSGRNDFRLHELRRETDMQHIELRLESIEDRHRRLRSARAEERSGSDSGRPIRHRLGESIIRIGRRIGGDALTAPAWQG